MYLGWKAYFDFQVTAGWCYVSDRCVKVLVYTYLARCVISHFDFLVVYIILWYTITVLAYIMADITAYITAQWSYIEYTWERKN